MKRLSLFFKKKCTAAEKNHAFLLKKSGHHSSWYTEFRY